jgi:hypothetical protein
MIVVACVIIVILMFLILAVGKRQSSRFNQMSCCTGNNLSYEPNEFRSVDYDTGQTYGQVKWPSVAESAFQQQKALGGGPEANTPFDLTQPRFDDVPSDCSTSTVPAYMMGGSNFPCE